MIQNIHLKHIQHDSKHILSAPTFHRCQLFQEGKRLLKFDLSSVQIDFNFLRYVD